MRKGAAIAGRVLQRCSLCKKFHAAYLVEDPQLGSLQLCRDCWNDRQKQEEKRNAKTESPDSSERCSRGA